MTTVQEMTQTIMAVKKPITAKLCDNLIEVVRYTPEELAQKKIEEREAVKEIHDFVSSFYAGKITVNDETTIPSLILDISLPEKMFAIEFNGLFDVKPKDFNAKKTKLCLDNGIHLFNIFADEWKNKKDIVKSMLKHRLNVSERKIHARDCEIRPVEKSLEREFLNNSHISGTAQSKGAFGLFYENELVMIISLKVPIQKKYLFTVELLRLASAQNTSVTGGFSKLFKHVKEWCAANGFEKMIAYSDKRFGQGKVYSENGFEHKGTTSSVDYWYTNGGKRHFRFKFRAQPGKPEKQVAEENGVWKTYGCAHNIFHYDLKK